MAKKIFTTKEIETLSTNPYVKSVSTKGITYTDEFKQIYITQSDNGKSAREIFEDCGFDIEIIGMERVRSARDRWRAAYSKNGLDGLQDTRRGNSGRPRERELTPDEKYSRLQAENNLLKAEIELLKKIRFAEREMKKK